MKNIFLLFIFAFTIFGLSYSVRADLSLKAAVITPVQASWTEQLPQDPVAATDMYMKRISPEAEARANAYFEGGYWLQLWNLILGLGISLFLLNSGWAIQWRNKIEKRFQSKVARLVSYAAVYLVVVQVISWPLAVYQGFFREHQYGLLNQSFLPWFGEQLMGSLIGLIFGSLLIAALYGVIRKWPDVWPVLGTGVCIIMLSILMLVGPSYIDPLFNTYKKVEEGALRTSLLSMAAANGIPAEDIYEFNASKQSDRVSANVSGFLGSTSIRLNDNLLRRTTPTEVRAVMGHEMGHYVLNHIYKSICALAIVFFIGLLFVQKSFEWLRVKYFKKWGIQSFGDMAGLPLLMALFTVFMFFMTPINNTITRAQEAEADLFGLNAAGEPDAAAEVNLKIVEYRKPDPTPLEEFIFFDHPGTRNRILMAMRWKAAKMQDNKN